MNYLINVHTYKPYKIEREFTIKASSHEVAIRRAVKQFRQDDKLKGRRITEIIVNSRRF